jgi:uncharacterized membrane-anchored protein YhcB (DUF1043 family)
MIVAGIAIVIGVAMGMMITHYWHHESVSIRSLKTLSLLAEVLSIKVYKLVSVSTYMASLMIVAGIAIVIGVAMGMMIRKK